MARGRSRGVALGLVAAVASAIALVCLLHRRARPLASSTRSTPASRSAAREEPPDDLVVVAIDDVSFGELDERWPFPRSLHGELIDRALRGGRRGDRLRRPVHRADRRRGEDNALIAAVADSGRPIVLATRRSNRRGETERVRRRGGARAGRRPGRQLRLRPRPRRRLPPAPLRRPAGSSRSRSPRSRSATARGRPRRTSRRRRRLDRLRGPAGDDPDLLVLAGPERRGRPGPFEARPSSSASAPRRCRTCTRSRPATTS